MGSSFRRSKKHPVHKRLQSLRSSRNATFHRIRYFSSSWCRTGLLDTLETVITVRRGIPLASQPATRVQFGLGAVLQYSNTPSLRAAGFEDDDKDSLSDVAFCARWLAVLSASEVGRTKRLVSSFKPLRGWNSGRALLTGLTRLFCKQQRSSTSTSTSTSTNAERRTRSAL